jgi:hypothetical protein
VVKFVVETVYEATSKEVLRHYIDSHVPCLVKDKKYRLKEIGESYQELVVDCVKNFNILQLLAMGVMLWFFYSRLNDKIERSEKEVMADRQIRR